MKITTTLKQLGDTEVLYISDVYAGEYLDTRVFIGGDCIIAIEGGKISEFHEKLEEVINKYRI